MKRLPQIDRFFTAVCSFMILALFVLLSSCEKESLEEDASRIKVQKLETASLRTMLAYEDCATSCIEEGSETYYVKSDSKSEINGSNEKKITYNAYNTESDFFVEVKYENTNSVKSNITINITGNISIINDVEDGDIVSHSIKLNEGWQACDQIGFSINASFNNGVGRGPSQNDINFNDESYALIGICASTCDESFSYIENEDGSYTFTYISSEDLEDAEVKFTCPHIKDFEAQDGKEYSVNPGNSHGSPTVLTWSGDIDACSVITFTLSFEADCEQTNSGKANLFTDFKVNGVSKKGDNENIVFACSE